MNNGTCFGYFSLERETRQHDPLSPYLFISESQKPYSFKSGVFVHKGLNKLK